MRIAILRLILLLALLGRLHAADSTADLAGSIGVEVVEVPAGASLAFSASAESTMPLSFQWLKNGSVMAESSGETLRFASITAENAGVYTALVSNSVGGTVSNAIVIVVTAANVPAAVPIITGQPIDAPISLAGSVSFQVGTSAGAAETYQWLKNGAPISGATGASLSLTNVLSSDSYSVVVSNSAGAVVSNVARALLPASAAGNATLPVITREPGDLQVAWSSNVMLSVMATGSPAPTFQWQKNGGPIAGATRSFLSLSGVTSSASYSVVVTNAAGSVLSRSASLVVNGAPAAPATPPVFTTQPGDQFALGSSSVTFVAAATGAPAPSYQWQRNGVNIPGATAAAFTLGAVSAQDAARYTVIASNAAGSVVSNAATLTVAIAPAFTSQPVSQAVTAGSGVTFSVATNGSPAPALQWRKNGLELSGATLSTLRFDAVTKNDEGSYDVQACNSAGAILSNAASLVVQVPYVPPPPPPPPAPSGPIAGVVQRANYTLTLDPGTKRTVAFMIRDRPKTILVRAVGPTLATLGVAGAMADPQIEMQSGLTLTNRNDNWGGGADLMKAFVEAGAAPLMSASSKDAAFVMTVAPGTYTAVVSAADGGGGTVLVEVYEFP